MARYINLPIQVPDGWPDNDAHAVQTVRKIRQAALDTAAALLDYGDMSAEERADIPGGSKAVGIDWETEEPYPGLFGYHAGTSMTGSGMNSGPAVPS